MTPTIRCSSLDRTLSCPGSVTLCARVRNRGGKEAAEGTAIHWDSANRLCLELGAVAPDGLGPQPNMVLAKNSMWISDFYVRLVRETVPSDWSIQVETGIAYQFEKFALSCHPDALALSPDITEAIIFDLKAGYDPVDVAEQNWQLAGNAVLVKRAYPTVRKVTVYLCQPRNDEDEGFPRVSSAEVTDIDALTAEVESRVNAAIEDPMTAEASRKACAWCAAATQCTATKQKRDEMKIKLTQEAVLAVKEMPDDATLADWIIASKILARPLKDATELAKDRIAEVGSITAPDGTRIGQKVERGSWTIPDPVKFFAAMRRFFPNDDAIARVTKPKMGDIKDELAVAMNIPKNSKVGTCAESVFKDNLAPLAEQGERRTFTFL